MTDKQAKKMGVGGKSSVPSGRARVGDLRTGSTRR